MDNNMNNDNDHSDERDYFAIVVEPDQNLADNPDDDQQDQPEQPEPQPEEEEEEDAPMTPEPQDLTFAPRKARVVWARMTRQEDVRARRRLFHSESPIRSPPRRIPRRRTVAARRREDLPPLGNRPIRRRLVDDFDNLAHELQQGNGQQNGFHTPAGQQRRGGRPGKKPDRSPNSI